MAKNIATLFFISNGMYVISNFSPEQRLMPSWQLTVIKE